LRVICGDEMGGLDWVVWLWALDIGWRDTAATWDFGGAAGAALLALDGLGLGLGGWDVEDVELAAGRWFDDGCDCWIMGDVVSVHDIVVPVSLTLLHSAGLEAEGACP